MIVERMEQREMQDRRQRRRSGRSARCAPPTVYSYASRPAVGPGHELHAVGPQRVELAHLRAALATDHRLDIGVAGEQQMRGDALEKRRAVLARVRPRAADRAADARSRSAAPS